MVRVSVVIVNKNEAALEQTLAALGPAGAGTMADEVIVVDASAGALE